MAVEPAKISLKSYIDGLDLFSIEDLTRLTLLLTKKEEVAVTVSWGQRFLSAAPFEGSILLEELAKKMRAACEPHWTALFQPEISLFSRSASSGDGLQDWHNSLTILVLLNQYYDQASRTHYCCLKALLLWIYDFFNLTKENLSEATEFISLVSAPQWALIKHHFHSSESDADPLQLSCPSGTKPAYHLSITAAEQLVKKNHLIGDIS